MDRSPLLVFTTGRNCAAYVEDNIRSIARQTLANAHVLFVDDASDDGTDRLAQAALQRWLPGRHHFVRNPERMGKAHNASVHLRALAPGYEAVAVVDADDLLIDITVLEQLVRAYQQGEDVVWTNYLSDQGRFGENGPLNRYVPPRQQPWLSSHLFSFRAALLARVPHGHFQYPDGRWLDAACDLAIAYPMLDQTRRWRYLPVRAYCYTESNPGSHHRLAGEAQSLSSPRQRECARIVLAKRPLPRIDEPEADGLHATPAVPAPAEAAASPWTAARLALAVPALLRELPASTLEALDPELLWDWWQWLDTHRGARVLALGDDAHTQALALLVQAADGEALALRGGDGPGHAPWTDVAFDAHHTRLPALDGLGGALFDAVHLAPNAWDGPRAPVVALAALAPQLRLDQPRLVFAGLHPARLDAVAAQIAALVPELPARAAGAGADALVVEACAAPAEATG
ncbi:glycosyltransferase [Hydrogenophaga crocea]|uniref:Glycosyltransferase family 2 protein n=1 Tax=Hydrogenophaga crocea TaxID=2716225 RepID=A0A6G8IN10_9BURK|nr:glycosyltransferase [Hydrogenophaga crocea]QIM54574.1 glycosyltransferase family 2 protein [Hydrogenophaga crocea]